MEAQHGRSAPLSLAAADAAAHRSPQGPTRWLKAPPWAREEERPPAAAMPRSGVLWALRLPANAAGPATVGQPALSVRRKAHPQPHNLARPDSHPRPRPVRYSHPRPVRHQALCRHCHLHPDAATLLSRQPARRALPHSVRRPPPLPPTPCTTSPPRARRPASTIKPHPTPGKSSSPSKLRSPSRLAAAAAAAAAAAREADARRRDEQVAALPPPRHPARTPREA